ncbi:hypothetical protein M3Y99_01026900 [Aphelenchoides fujianensis]|nr:hypothetical protein M3Y99_01026900 [Aphelenchoides fujianensis]
MKFACVFVLLVVLVVLQDAQAARNRKKRLSVASVSDGNGRGRVYVNGREIDAGSGNPTVVTAGNNGCTVVNGVVHEPDGSRRPLTAEDRRLLDEYDRQVKEYFDKLFPPNFPFEKAPEGLQHPPFPAICRSHAGGSGAGSGQASGNFGSGSGSGSGNQF